MTKVGSIEAVLTLNSTGFTDGLSTATTALNKFANATTKLNNSKPANAMLQLNDALIQLESSLGSLDGVSQKNISTFSKLSNAVKNMATGLQMLQSDTVNVEEAVNTMNSIFKSFQGVVQGGTVEVRGLASALKELRLSENQQAESVERTNTVENEQINTLRRMQKELNLVAQGIKQFNAVDSTSDSVRRLQSQMKVMESEFKSAQQWMLNFANTGVEAFNRIGRSVSNVYNKIDPMKLSNNFKNPLDSGDRLAKQTAFIEQNSQAMRQNGAEVLRNMGYRGKLSIEEEKQTLSNEKNSASAQRNSNAMNRQASASRGLGRALSSLKMMGTMVASMFAYNFAHKLMMATSETVHAKSEMEGYFKMLHYSQGEINHFNKKLDETVGQFQRINKYSLGETISSIGVEFDLSTKEMEKAMPVVSMITSEYLRAGRNANEASLAVKDILQGEFQRLSRETGVKGDQLKEAGWSGDKTDVMGLLEALDKVGKARNWDEFVVKANSLNDIITILQNRFGKWSADMVNVVQPSIVGAFNSMMEFGGGLSQSLSGLWKWLNGKSWEATAVKIGGIVTAIMTLMPMLTAYRTGAGLLQASNMSLAQSIAGLIFGIDAETLAMSTGSSAIAMRIAGIEAEEVAESGVLRVVAGRILGLQTEMVTTEMATAVNSGFIGSLYALVTGKSLAEAGSLSLSGAIAILSASFLTSPIGIFTVAVLGLASAFYVLTGGLDDSWGKMKKFHEAMKDPDSVMESQYKRLDRLKKEVGETSQKYIDAKNSVDGFYKRLQSSKAQYDKSEEDYEGIGQGVDSNVQDILKRNGVDDKTVDKFITNSGYLSKGKKKYYEADQVLNKQIYDSNSNFSKDYEELVKNMDTNSKDFENASDKLIGNYQNLAEHSYIANTSDDWWEWMWNSFYAGLDQMWIDLDKFVNVQIKELWNSITTMDLMTLLGLDPNKDYVGKFTTWFSDTITSVFGGINQYLGDLLSSFDFNGWISSIIDLPRWIGEWIGNALGSLNLGELLQTHLGNVWNEAFAPLIQGVTVDFPNYVMSSIGRWSEVFTSLVTTVSGIFNGLKTRIWNTLTGIASNVSTGFNTVKDYAVSKMSAMQQGVKSAIDKVIGAFTHMKDMILDSAKKIWDGVKSKFDGVSKTIGDFYHKLTNPSEWFSGGGQKSWSSSPKPNTARRLFGVRSNGKHGAGSPNPYQKGNSGKTVTLDELVSQLGGNKRVNLTDFLSLFANSGFGAWDFAKKHKDTIYGKAKNWNANAPSMNGITLGTVYPLSRFWSGEAKGFTWDEFMRVAKAIFSNVPYKFYMDSDWKGNWVSALLSGAMNCSDGADALLALASLFGFSGEKIHTNLKNGTGHFYTRINGHNLDTTHFQNSGSWSPLSGGGSPVRHVGGYPSGKTVNINIQFNEPVYGVDDLDSRIKQSTKDALKEEFNDPWAVAI